MTDEKPVHPDKVRDEAKERVKGWINKPEHHIHEGSPEDEATRTGDLDDPALQQEDDE